MRRIPILLLSALSLAAFISGDAAYGANFDKTSTWHAVTAGATADEPYTVETSPEDNGVRLSWRLHGYRTREVSTAQGGFVEIELGDLGVSGMEGTPELPAWRRYVEVPTNASRVWLEVNETALRDGTAEGAALEHAVMPVQPPQVKMPQGQNRPAFTYKDEFYAKTVQTQPKAVEMRRFGTVRGRNLYALTVFPFDYNPKTNTLTVRKHVECVVRWEIAQESSARQQNRAERLHSAPFAKVFETSVLNWQGSSRRGLDAERPSYLIISPEQFADDPSLLDFAQSKRTRGFMVDIASLDEIGTEAEQIKVFIQNAYENWPEPPTFVLLVGDVDQMPCWHSGGFNFLATDLYYAAVDGDEWTTPDLYVGRFPAADAEDLRNMVDKTLAYEAGVWPAGYTGWETRAAFMTGYDNYTITEGTHEAVIDAHLSPAGYELDRLYMQTESARTPDITAAVEAGCSLAVYSGHGNETNWADGPPFTQANVEAFANEVYPFVFSFACLTGSYSVDECFAETWLRHEHGAAAFLGSSTYSYWDEDDIFQKRIFDGLFDHDIHWFSGMVRYGLIELLAHYGETNMMRTYFEMYNVMGDPGIGLYTAPAAPLEVTHASFIAAGSSSFAIDCPVEGALAAVLQDGQLLGAAEIVNGTAEVPLDPAVVQGEVDVHVTAPNSVAYHAAVATASGPTAQIALDRGAYGCPAQIEVTVADSDLIGSTGAAIDMTAGADTETVSLLATGTPGVFRAYVDLECAAYSPGDGVLQAAHGDLVEALYLDYNADAEMPEWKTAAAVVDSQAPVISDASVDEVTDTSALVRFTTDETAISRVSCGESCGGPYPITKETKSVFTEHAVRIGGLAPNTIYFIEVEAWDAFGNISDEPLCITFKTAPVKDYLTELFTDSDNDLDNLTLTFAPDDQSNYYMIKSDAASSFPTSPSDGTMLALSDDDSEEVTLSAGRTVSLFGVEYASFFVGSNGYITFTEGHQEYLETLDEHFAYPRISALFDDFNPSASGEISVRELSDRVAVTYENIPEFGVSTRSSFQVEMFYDGKLRLTWLNIGATDGLAGLSRGEGLPSDFAESDLSAYEGGAPNVTGVRRVCSDATSDSLIEFLVSFDAAVSGVDELDFVLSAAGLPGASIHAVEAVSLNLYSVLVSTGEGEGNLRLDVVDNNSIIDLFDAPLGGPSTHDGSYDAGDVVFVDRKAPSVSVNSAAAANPSPGFSGSVDDAQAQINVSVGGHSAAVETIIQGVWILAADAIPPLPDGVYDVEVEAVDAIGNVGRDVTKDELVIDTTAPTLENVVVRGSDIIEVTFSEEMDAAALTAENFVLSGEGMGDLAVNPDGVYYLGDGVFRLTWARGSMVDGADVTVSASGAVDLLGNANGDGATGTATVGADEALPIGATSSAAALVLALGAFAARRRRLAG